MSPKIISVVNCKGGVGKSTTTLNICAGLARLGKRVLGVDLDPQQNLTHSIIGELEEGSPNITEAILQKNTLKDVIRNTHVKNFDIAPAGDTMIDLELKLHSEFARESKLKNILQDSYVNQYDYVLIDNSPHIALKTINSLVASNYFVVPSSAEYLPLIGLKHLLKIVEQIKPLNNTLKNLGFIITMFDRRESISLDVEKILRETFENDVFKNIIRVNTKLKVCPQKRHTIFDVEKPSGKGFMDYAAVSKEFLNRIEATS